MNPRYGGTRQRTPARPALDPLDLGRKHRPDYWIVALASVLIAIGVVTVYAISPAFDSSSKGSGNAIVVRQLIAIFLSVAAFIATATIPLQWWKSMAKPLLVLAGLGTLIALATPVNPAYPAHRWVRLGSLSFQSVELVKYGVLIAFAAFVSGQAKKGLLEDVNKTLKPIGIGVLTVAIFIAGPQKIHAQSDLGSMMVMVAMVATMAFVIGFPLKKLAMGAGMLAIVATLVILPSAYRRERLATFFNPAADCQSQGYQACQALIAVGSGGLIGQGIGSGAQAYGWLPEAANDSIFAIFGEKFGFVGSVALIGLFVALFSRIKKVAERIEDDFSRLLAVGVLAWLSIQSIINIGAMIGLLPLKGITLPFISYGGTSVIFITAAVGLVFQVSRYTAFSAPRISSEGGKAKDDHRFDGRRVRGAYHPNLGSRG